MKRPVLLLPLALVASAVRVAIVPGIETEDVTKENWYLWAKNEIQKIPGVTEVVLKNMPDPMGAKESLWIPFMHNEMHIDADTVIIGHSSGAQAAMRFAEANPVRGIMLISVEMTDMGDEKERASGYYSRPWDWGKIRANSGFVVQFGSTDDPYIPWKEQQAVRDNLGTELHKFPDRGHFMGKAYPEIVAVLRQKLGARRRLRGD